MSLYLCFKFQTFFFIILICTLVWMLPFKGILLFAQLQGQHLSRGTLLNFAPYMPHLFHLRLCPLGWKVFTVSSRSGFNRGILGASSASQSFTDRMWQSMKKCSCGWFMLMDGRGQHNIVKQLSANKKKMKRKKCKHKNLRKWRNSFNCLSITDTDALVTCNSYILLPDSKHCMCLHGFGLETLLFMLNLLRTFCISVSTLRFLLLLKVQLKCLSTSVTPLLERIVGWNINSFITRKLP